MSYTWEEVMLNIDVRREAEKEQKQQQDILDEQAAEESAMGWWSLGLSVLGGAIFGPAGYAAGKIIGRGVGDITHDWEDMAVDTGKFYKKEAEEFKKTRDKAVKDQDVGQIFNAVTDLATMYVQAGGLKEGFEGWSDLTTFGTGEDAWTVFGEGAKLPDIPGIGGEGWDMPGVQLPADQSIFAGGGAKLWEAGGFKQLSENLKKGNLQSAWATDQGISNLSDLGRLALSYQESEDEKPKGRTFGRFSS